MKLPITPQLKKLTSISPTLFESARVCNARAAYQAFGERHAIPPHPSQLLGTAYHFIMQQATLGKIQGADLDQRAERARLLFDATASELYATSHPLVRCKFETAADMPFYALFRERASQKGATISTETAGKTHASYAGRPNSSFLRVEKELYSRDRQIRGRPDLVKIERCEVIDYKSGSATEIDAEGVRDPERRQLLLYGYLLQENDIVVNNGVIERGNGAMGRIAITSGACDREAEAARIALQRFNDTMSGGFDVLARPSPEVCSGCHAIPQCRAFWEAASEEWIDLVGAHAEGIITDIRSQVLNRVEVTTVRLQIDAGTIKPGEGSLEQVPLNWMTADGTPAPSTGDRIRIVDAQVASEEPVVIRADKTMTAVWGPI